MDATKAEVIQECSALSLSAKITFPEVVRRLTEVGVERYHADYCRQEITFYFMDGDSLVVPSPHPAHVLATEFSPAAVEAAVRQSQRSEHTYPDFVRKTMVAGCVGYFVQIVGQCAIYFGRDGASHVERFPSAPGNPATSDSPKAASVSRGPETALSARAENGLPQVSGILETALSVSNLSKSAAFFERLFGFHKLLETERLIALNVAGRDVLLLFPHDATNEPFSTPGGVIPAHGSSGKSHLAFSMAAESVTAWKNRLTSEGIEIESIVTWPSGAQSVYFRDPDEHLLELITPGFWAIY